MVNRHLPSNFSACWISTIDTASCTQPLKVMIVLYPSVVYYCWIGNESKPYLQVELLLGTINMITFLCGWLFNKYVDVKLHHACKFGLTTRNQSAGTSLFDHDCHSHNVGHAMHPSDRIVLLVPAKFVLWPSYLRNEVRFVLYFHSPLNRMNTISWLATSSFSMFGIVYMIVLCQIYMAEAQEVSDSDWDGSCRVVTMFRFLSEKAPCISRPHPCSRSAICGRTQPTQLRTSVVLRLLTTEVLTRSLHSGSGRPPPQEAKRPLEFPANQQYGGHHRHGIYVCRIVHLSKTCKAAVSVPNTAAFLLYGRRF